MSFVQELKRRNVFRVAVAYVVAAWVITEVSSLILEIYESPDSIMRVIVALLALGLPFAIVFAWAFEVTPEGDIVWSYVLSYDATYAALIENAERVPEDFFTIDDWTCS